MFKTLALTAGLFCAAIGGVSAATIDPLGSITAQQRIAVEPPVGVSGSFEVDAGTALAITVDLSVRHRGASWGSETRLRIWAPDGTVFNFLGGRDFGWANQSGVFGTVYTRDIAAVDAGGTWAFRLSDSFDDGVDPDYFVRRGSSITISGTPAPVPLPASAAMLLLGMGGLMAFRRKANA